MLTLPDSCHRNTGPIRDLLKTAEGKLWLFYGDSITHGFKHVQGWRSYPELFAERTRGEMFRRKDIVINSAVSGNTSVELIRDLDRRAARFAPDAAFLMIGMNDCKESRGMPPEAFRSNLEILCDAFSAMNSRVILQTTPPPVAALCPERARFPLFMDQVRCVADERALPLIDHSAWWSKQPQSHLFWMNNAYHPNHFGHIVLARALFSALGVEDDASPVCRLAFPT